MCEPWQTATLGNLCVDMGVLTYSGKESENVVIASVSMLVCIFGVSLCLVCICVSVCLSV